MPAFEESPKAAARRLRTVRCQRVLMTNDATNKKMGAGRHALDHAVAEKLPASSPNFHRFFTSSKNAGAKFTLSKFRSF
jgi:hypothetical protein